MTRTRLFLAALLVSALPTVGTAIAAVEESGAGIPPDMSNDSSTTPSEYAIPPVNPNIIMHPLPVEWTAVPHPA